MKDGFDVSKVNSIIDGYGEDKELLVSILHEVQAEYGYLPRDAIVPVSYTHLRAHET